MDNLKEMDSSLSASSMSSNEEDFENSSDNEFADIDKEKTKINIGDSHNSLSRITNKQSEKENLQQKVPMSNKFSTNSNLPGQRKLFTIKLKDGKISSPKTTSIIGMPVKNLAYRTPKVVSNPKTSSGVKHVAIRSQVKSPNISQNIIKPQATASQKSMFYRLETIPVKDASNPLAISDSKQLDKESMKNKSNIVNVSSLLSASLDTESDDDLDNFAKDDFSESNNDPSEIPNLNNIEIIDVSESEEDESLSKSKLNNSEKMELIKIPPAENRTLSQAVKTNIQTNIPQRKSELPRCLYIPSTTKSANTSAATKSALTPAASKSAHSPAATKSAIPTTLKAVATKSSPCNLGKSPEIVNQPIKMKNQDATKAGIPKVKQLDTNNQDTTKLGIPRLIAPKLLTIPAVATTSTSVAQIAIKSVTKTDSAKTLSSLGTPVTSAVMSTTNTVNITTNLPSSDEVTRLASVQGQSVNVSGQNVIMHSGSSIVPQNSLVVGSTLTPSLNFVVPKEDIVKCKENNTPLVLSVPPLVPTGGSQPTTVGSRNLLMILPQQLPSNLRGPGVVNFLVSNPHYRPNVAVQIPANNSQTTNIQQIGQTTLLQQRLTSVQPKSPAIFPKISLSVNKPSTSKDRPLISNTSADDPGIKILNTKEKDGPNWCWYAPKFGKRDLEGFLYRDRLGFSKTEVEKSKKCWRKLNVAVYRKQIELDSLATNIIRIKRGTKAQSSILNKPSRNTPTSERRPTPRIIRRGAHKNTRKQEPETLKEMLQSKKIKLVSLDDLKKQTEENSVISGEDEENNSFAPPADDQDDDDDDNGSDLYYTKKVVILRNTNRNPHRRKTKRLGRLPKIKLGQARSVNQNYQKQRTFKPSLPSVRKCCVALERNDELEAILKEQLPVKEVVEEGRARRKRKLDLESMGLIKKVRRRNAIDTPIVNEKPKLTSKIETGPSVTNTNIFAPEHPDEIASSSSDNIKGVLEKHFDISPGHQRGTQTDYKKSVFMSYREYQKISKLSHTEIIFIFTLNTIHILEDLRLSETRPLLVLDQFNFKFDFDTINNYNVVFTRDDYEPLPIALLKNLELVYLIRHGHIKVVSRPVLCKYLLEKCNLMQSYNERIPVNAKSNKDSGYMKHKHSDNVKEKQERKEDPKEKFAKSLSLKRNIAEQKLSEVPVKKQAIKVRKDLMQPKPSTSTYSKPAPRQKKEERIRQIKRITRRSTSQSSQKSNSEQNVEGKPKSTRQKLVSNTESLDTKFNEIEKNLSMMFEKTKQATSDTSTNVISSSQNAPGGSGLSLTRTSEILHSRDTTPDLDYLFTNSGEDNSNLDKRAESTGSAAVHHSSEANQGYSNEPSSSNPQKRRRGRPAKKISNKIDNIAKNDAASLEKMLISSESEDIEKLDQLNPTTKTACSTVDILSSKNNDVVSPNNSHVESKKSLNETSNDDVESSADVKASSKNTYVTSINETSEGVVESSTNIPLSSESSQVEHPENNDEISKDIVDSSKNSYVPSVNETSKDDVESSTNIPESLECSHVEHIENIDEISKDDVDSSAIPLTSAKATFESDENLNEPSKDGVDSSTTILASAEGSLLESGQNLNEPSKDDIESSTDIHSNTGTTLHIENELGEDQIEKAFEAKSASDVDNSVEIEADEKQDQDAEKCSNNSIEYIEQELELDTTEEQNRSENILQKSLEEAGIESPSGQEKADNETPSGSKDLFGTCEETSEDTNSLSPDTVGKLDAATDVRETSYPKEDEDVVTSSYPEEGKNIVISSYPEEDKDVVSSSDKLDVDQFLTKPSDDTLESDVSLDTNPFLDSSEDPTLENKTETITTENVTLLNETADLPETAPEIEMAVKEVETDTEISKNDTEIGDILKSTSLSEEDNTLKESDPIIPQDDQLIQLTPEKLDSTENIQMETSNEDIEMDTLQISSCTIDVEDSSKMNYTETSFGSNSMDVEVLNDEVTESIRSSEFEIFDNSSEKVAGNSTVTPSNLEFDDGASVQDNIIGLSTKDTTDTENLLSTCEMDTDIAMCSDEISKNLPDDYLEK